MNRSVKLFNLIQLFIVGVYLYINHKTINDFPCDLVNVYTVPISEYIIIVIFLIIQINKIAPFTLCFLLVSLGATSYYIYSYVEIIHNCSNKLSKELHIFLVYMLTTLIINNGILLIYLCIGINSQKNQYNQPIFPAAIINEDQPLLSEEQN